ncbi:G-protein coupled receptor Mth2-like isoform X1 [Anoplolepis gracilipes]|uniref:G-protein coupled receptor Mth2-like isoform X1 n=1 Tax=Anoplolepis gracilipes TaxID=354296 RepID=UPI003BA2A510
MYGKSFGLWCCALLFFASSTKPLRNFTIVNKQDNNTMMKNDLDANTSEKNGNETIFNQYDLRKNFTMNYKDDQNVFHINFRRNGRKDDSIQIESPLHYVKYYEERNQIPSEIEKNFTNVDNKKRSNNENDNTDYIVPYKNVPYDNRTCIHLCCPLGDRYESFGTCNIEGPGYVFSDVYNFLSETNMQTEYKKVDEMFQLIVQDPCPNRSEIVAIRLNDDSIEYYEYIFFENGTLYLSYFDQFVKSTSFCLAFSNQGQVDAIICSKTLTEAVKKEKDYFLTFIKPLKDRMYILDLICGTVSMLCMLLIFLVYYILPEFNNIHSFMLRRYSSMVFIFYLSHTSVMLIKRENLAYSICIASGLVSYFSSLASSFWLSIMSFDMWWKFRNFRSLARKVDQQKKKKFIYSIIAWGSPFILTITCIIMEFVPSVPRNMIRPRFQNSTCWFRYGAADQLYNYGSKIICIVISIFLSIYTALKIMGYMKDTARYFRDTEARRFNENEKWDNLYLKLFIMSFVIMAVEWILMTVWEFWLIKKVIITTMYISFSICILKTIKYISIFILFVCKRRVMQLLLKHFCRNRRYVSETFK